MILDTVAPTSVSALAWAAVGGLGLVAGPWFWPRDDDGGCRRRVGHWGGDGTILDSKATATEIKRELAERVAVLTAAGRRPSWRR